MAQPVTLRAKQLSCCEKNFLVVSSHTMAIRIGQRRHAIWHCATSFFGGLWTLVSMPTNHKQFLSSRCRFDVSLAKLSRNYAETSSRVSSKEQVCASRVVWDICRILRSTINCSVCTLYWHKNISTFLINGTFYYKIKSCALVGTPCIIVNGQDSFRYTADITSVAYITEMSNHMTRQKLYIYKSWKGVHLNDRHPVI